MESSMPRNQVRCMLRAQQDSIAEVADGMARL